MRLITIGASAIDVERRIAQDALTSLYQRYKDEDVRIDLLVLLGNMDVVIINQTNDGFRFSAYIGNDIHIRPRFIIEDYDAPDNIVDFMYKWGGNLPSHIIGYAYEREE